MQHTYVSCDVTCHGMLIINPFYRWSFWRLQGKFHAVAQLPSISPSIL